MHKLSPQQIRFVDAVMEGRNRTDAYIRAGYKIKNRRNVRSAAARLYANPGVQREIQRREKAVRRRNFHHLTRLSQDALDELSKMMRECQNERVRLDAIKAILEYAGLRPEAEPEHDGESAAVVTLKDVVLGLGQRNEKLASEYWDSSDSPKLSAPVPGECDTESE